KVVTGMTRVGVEAIPIVGLIAALMGVILALNSAGQLRAYGAEKYTANLVGIALTRELAPVITAILVAGRSGSAIAAEIATMNVSDEVDALRVMGINSRAFLLVPKLLALTLAMPVLVVLSSLVGIAGGFAVAILGLHLPFEVYWDQTIKALHVQDLVLGSAKALVFGALIGLTGCTLGMRVKGGATGVGRVTTTAVVTSYVLVIVANTVFTLHFFLAGWWRDGRRRTRRRGGRAALLVRRARGPRGRRPRGPARRDRDDHGAERLRQDDAAARARRARDARRRLGARAGAGGRQA